MKLAIIDNNGKTHELIDEIEKYVLILQDAKIVNAIYDRIQRIKAREAKAKV